MESILIIAIALCSVQRIAAVPQIEGRILGGSEVDIKEVPYQVFFAVNGILFCGGAIISPTFILTAAHCTTHMQDITKVRVKAGTSYINSGGISKKMRTVLPHKRYDNRTRDHDYCLVELDSPVKFSKSVKAVALPGEHELVKDGETCLVSGWGLTGGTTQRPTNLMAANVTIINKYECNKIHRTPITHQMVCTGSSKGDIGACSGDCGGPLVCRGKLVGIVSWGFTNACELPENPSVYSFVAAAKTWITGVTGV